ncbi:MAG: 30S ribosomal protein S4 [Candidatus Nomurabacteria bacterium]|nr:30S ribosomal protein S4 [Candidatus Nomurabacteria bacterium]
MSIKLKKFKIARRLGAGVFDKTQSQKFALANAKKRTTGRRPRVTDYGLQLIEKQRVRVMYGVREKQFRNYINKAIGATKQGASPALALFKSLESRLDNIVYRLGLAESRRMARQMVSHGHFTVNGKKTTIPSYSLRVNDELAIREGSKDIKIFELIDNKLKNHTAPNWLKWNAKQRSAVVAGEPTDPDSFLNFNSVIEFYSR